MYVVHNLCPLRVGVHSIAWGRRRHYTVSLNSQMSVENPNGFIHEEERDEVLEVTVTKPTRKHRRLAPLDSDCDR